MLAHRRSQPHGRAAPLERGETLIELLLTIVLMGMTVAATLAGIITTTKVSDQNTKMTSAGVLAQAYAEELKQPVSPTGGPAMAYKPCATPTGGTAYPAYSGVKPNGYTITVTAVEFWDGTYDGSGATKTPKFVSSCANEKGLQRITVVADSNSAVFRSKETLVIIKRDANCPTTFSSADLGPC